MKEDSELDISDELRERATELRETNAQLQVELAKRKKVDDRLNGINKVFREGIVCETEEQLGKTCLAIAQELTSSKFGFIGRLNEDGSFTTFALSDPGWDACRIPESDATKLFSNLPVRGLWGAVIKSEQPLIVNNPSTHPDRVGTPEGHPPLTSFLGIPLKHAGKTFGMIALANKNGGYSTEDQQTMETLSTAIVEALMHKQAELKVKSQTQQLNSRMKELEERDQAIRSLSTPLTQIWEGVVMIPIVGILDSARAKQLTESVLNYVALTKTEIVILSIEGIAAIDAQTASYILRTMHATKLMGSEMIITGVRPDVAATLVTLDIDLSSIATRGTMREGLKYAFAKLGLEVVKSQ